MTLHPEIYLDALEVQYACNISGILQSMAKLPQLIQEDGAARNESYSTSELARHPVMVLFADKVADLAGISRPMEDEVCRSAYAICLERARTLMPVLPPGCRGWLKRCGPVHLTHDRVPNTTLCGMALLGNDYMKHRVEKTRCEACYAKAAELDLVTAQ